MKKIIISIFLFSTLNTYSQNQLKAFDSFHEVIRKFNVFFQTPQKLIYKQKFDQSPSGFIVEIMEYSCENFTYDIERTQSNATPYVGYIEINLTEKSNAVCGNVYYSIAGYKKFVGWDTEKGALANSEIQKCYIQQSEIAKYLKLELSSSTTVKFKYAYNNNKWIFLSVNVADIKYEIPSLPISCAIGSYFGNILPLTDKESIEFNAKWKTLVN